MSTTTRIVGGRFVKDNGRAPPGMFAAEATGLAWLAQARVLRVPRVFDFDDTHITLEHIAPGARGRDFDETLGTGLARLHAVGAPCFGLPADNFIAVLPQDNTVTPSWPEFYAERRLRSMAAFAGLSASTRARIDVLCAKLPSLLPEEPPARLHGDLWQGNVLCATDGAPVLIDPAVYGGHREMDLAMLRLFGGVSERCFAAYDEARPLAPGALERVPLHQLYPLLVHAALFGGGYVADVERVLARYT